MSAQSSNNDLDWSMHGMSRREMVSRIKQNRAMARAASQRAIQYNTQVSPEIKTWLDDGKAERTPWLVDIFAKREGYYDQVDNYRKGKAQHNKYVKRMDYSLKMIDKLNAMDANKLKKDLNKLLYGSK